VPSLTRNWRWRCICARRRKIQFEGRLAGCTGPFSPCSRWP
jgi:hypothetical protein